MTDRYTQHQNQLNERTLFIQKAIPEIRFQDRHVGQFYSKRMLFAIKQIQTISQLKFFFTNMKKYLVTINKPGMPDQYAILPIKISGIILPLHIEIEEKSGRAKLSEDQKKWKSKYEKIGVKHIVARDKHEVLKEILDYKDIIIKNIKKESL